LGLMGEGRSRFLGGEQASKQQLINVGDGESG
jgi:hypothetical protein